MTGQSNQLTCIDEELFGLLFAGEELGDRARAINLPVYMKNCLDFCLRVRN